MKCPECGKEVWYHPPQFFVTAEALSRLLDLPVTWIKSMTSNGRLPHLRLKNKVVYDYTTVRESLLERMKKNEVL